MPLSNTVYLIAGILFTFCFGSCKKTEEPATNSDIYIIKSGSHSANGKGVDVSGKVLSFLVTFDSSAVYKTSIPENQEDINKLFGFSDCDSHHHTNSARFGWRWFNSSLQIFAYCYNQGQRVDNFITSVELNKKYLYKISLTDSEYKFELDNKSIAVPRACSGPGVNKYFLLPYFGGDEKAPHNIIIKMEHVP
ncbi:MAG: hypothetical protein ACK40G_06070 [Cytophagaceae bacterium]